jgi:hypothetical protein
MMYSASNDVPYRTWVAITGLFTIYVTIMYSMHWSIYQVPPAEDIASRMIRAWEEGPMTPFRTCSLRLECNLEGFLRQKMPVLA